MTAYDTKMLDHLMTAKRFCVQMIEQGYCNDEMNLIHSSVSDALRLHQIEVGRLEESNDRLRSKIATMEMAQGAYKVMREKDRADLEKLSCGLDLVRGIAEAGYYAGEGAKDMAFRRIVDTAEETLSTTCNVAEVEQQDGFFPEIRVEVTQ